MKLLVFLCIFCLIASAMAGTDLYPRGCIYIMGHCSKACPEGTHAFATGCSQLLPEPTCDNPSPVKEEGIICDFSSCYCDPPTVKDKITNKCIPLEECPQKS